MSRETTRLSPKRDDIPRKRATLPGLFFALTALSLLILTYYIQGTEPYHCRALLHDGHWPDRHGIRDPDQDFAKWEPRTCRMTEYSRDAFHQCLGGRRLVFAGDSTIRQIYWAAAARLNHEKAHVALLDVFVDDSKHDNLFFEAEGVKLEFIWDPWLNSSLLHSELTRFRAQETFADVGTVRSKDEESAALVILGSPGLWAARHGHDEYMDIFKRGVDSMKIHISANLHDSLVSPTKDVRRNNDVAPNQILLAPVQVPWYSSLSVDRAKTITPEKVDSMNAYLAALSPQEQSHVLWAYNQMTVGDELAFEINGIHVTDRVAERKIDLALNARCNSARGHEVPNEVTCCMRYPKRNSLHVAICVGTIVLCIVLAIRSKGQDSIVSLYPATSLGAAMTILTVLVYCRTADRQHSYLKVNRHYEASVFLSTCLAFWVASFLSLQGSKRSRRPSLPNNRDIGADVKTSRQDSQGFLSRDQSDELKGWMQAMILIYHYNHASQTLWVYKLVRILVSGYIFLSGYGHTTYFLRTGDFSLQRVASVLFRLNFLSAILPYQMDTDYNFYYFAPVITFWYIVVYLTLRVFRQFNQDPLMLLGKVVVAAIATSCFILIPQPLQLVSTICRVVFNMHWDSTEVRFRLKIDRYIVFFGMLAASISHRMSVLRTSNTNPGWYQWNMSGLGRPSLIDPALSVLEFPDHLTKPIKPLACTFSALFILFHTVVTQTQLEDKTEYNIAHPYISWIPILSFLILRNSHERLRNAYLALPAALGKVSLETYVLQYHIWLGGDATAKLSMGISDRFGSTTWPAVLGRYFEILLISGTFICASAYVRNATDKLTKRLFYNSWPSTRRAPALETSKNGEKERGLALNRAYQDEASSHWPQRLTKLLSTDLRVKILVMCLVLWCGNQMF